ncbi:hypothetical protein DRH27_05085 [Candidatus Falkowbacteria bacterium]|nr:MAG: hypothetical protein DRH27_05085 [Candidatus Falkowbacteria bacterium]
MKKYLDIFFLVPAPIIFLVAFCFFVFWGCLIHQPEIKKNYFNGKIPGEIDSYELIIALKKNILTKKLKEKT